MSEDIEIHRRRRVIWILVTVLSLPFLFFAYQRMHGINTVKAKLNDLRAAGEEIDYRRLERAIPPPKSNAVVVLTNYFSRLEDMDNLLRSRPRVHQSEPDHRQRLFLDLEEWEFQIWVGDDLEKRTNNWPSFMIEFEPHTNLLHDVVLALERPEFHSGYRAVDGFSRLPMTVLMNSRKVEKLLAGGFSYHVRLGSFEEADRCLNSLLRLIEGMSNDQLIITELVRDAIFHTTRHAIWQALQLDGWTDEQLKSWSEGVKRLGFAEGMVNALRMERAVGYTYFQRLAGRDGNERQRRQAWDMVWELMNRNSQNEYFYIPMWHFVWQEQDYSQYFDAWTATLNHQRSANKVGWLAVLKHSGTGGGSLPFEPTEYTAPPDIWWNRFRYLFSQTWSPTGNTRRTMTTASLQRLTLTAIALHRYQLRYGNFPRDLDVLVPNYLHSIPLDLMDLKPLRYQTEDDSWHLYSIGENGTDDGGDRSPIKPGTDVASEMQRNDIAWPQPAN